jgi:hypothetical protein
MRRVVLAVVLGLVVTAPGGAATPAYKVVASDLNNPRKISLGSDGSLYVVEAGTGGPHCSTSCVGFTGSVTRVVNGKQARVVTGLLSVSNQTGQDAQGPADVVVQNGRYFTLIQDMRNLGSKQPDPRAPYLGTAGKLISTPPGTVRPTTVADLSTFELAHNPDHGAGPGARYNQPPLESDPYALTPFRGGFAVADAAANDLLWVSPAGNVSLLAVFPTKPTKLTAAEIRHLGKGAPSILPVQATPTSVVVGPDGALYVGELTGWPYRPGAANVWRIVPGEKPAVFAKGFTSISDLAFDGKDLIVLEIASQGGLRGDGAVIRVAPSGKRTVIASAGLTYPTGVAVGNGSIYVSNNGVFPGKGTTPHGEVVIVGRAGAAPA